ncbi:uncharacterized protein LOC142584794 isoform X2 [Dermacentor variabilis]|uniref:uncharacterized protein LOC142584794 isoform X2 n=1 Tax=Dermacentor variabilis TaxID=34621 RepID=UPI003F5B368E
MPPRKNTARRGRPFKFGEGGDRTASQDDAPSDVAAVASSDVTEKPSPQAKKPAVPPRKGAAPKPSPAKPRAAAIEPAAKKRAIAAKPAAKKEDPTARTISDASEADAEDDGAFEALVLDADDDDEVLAETAGDGETGVGDDSVSAGNEEGVAESADQGAEGGDAGAGEADEAPGDDVGAEEGNGDYAGEPEEGAEGWQGDADGADCEDDGAAEVDPNEEGAEEGGEAEYAEGDEMGDAEHPAEDELEGDAAGDDALGADAANDATEAGADDGAEALENGVSADPEHEESGDVAAAATGSGEGEGETIVGDLAPSERDFVMAEVEEIKDEPTTEVTRLWDLCPDVELDSAETITASVHDTIQRSVRQFIERLLRDAKETGTVPDDASAAAQDGKPVYGCNLCNVQMDQPELFDCHVESQRHIKRLRWMYFMGMNKELSKFHCRVCHISVPCKDHLVGHLRSDRHVCLSKSLNVHPKYSEHLLSQHFPKAKVKSLLQSQQQQQQQQPSTTASQPSATGKGKEQKGADKRPDKGKANAGSGQQGKREQSPPPINSNFIFHCELCEVIGYNEDQIQEHYRGKKHRAKMAEELEKLSNKKQDTTKKAPAKGDGSGSQANKESPKGPAKGPAKGPGPNKKGPISRPQQQQFRMKQGPKFGGGGPTYTCYVCNVVLHSTRDYSQHFTTRAHRMATGLQASGPPFDRKRPRSPSPFSRPPAWSPPRMRSPPRDLWSGGPPQRKRSPEPFLDPMARDLFAPPSGPGGSFEPGFRGPQAGMLEDYGERRGPRGGGGSEMPDPSSVAATLETMIQLQQRLLNMTGPQDSGGYHDEEFKAVARNLQDMDLQKSLQQLRQSQRYNVGPSPPPYGGGSTPTGTSRSMQSGPYMDSSPPPFRESGSSYQGGMGDGFAGKRGPYGGGVDSYSPGGDDRKGSYGMGGSFGGGGPGGSGGPRMNEYRKSSLGPTAPRPTGFGLPPLSHMRGRGGGASRY